MQKPGPLLRQLIALQRLEEEAVRYPQIQSWADSLIACADQFPGCVVWPVGIPAERIAGLATARAHGRVHVGLGNEQVDGRTILLFAVAGATALSLELTASQLRRRGAAEVHACAIALRGERDADEIDSFHTLGDPARTAPRSAAA